jgi:hypothetical protein
MMINYLALATAIVLSFVAAYYSIVGLAVIFASALIPVVVMASALEAGKVISASWLYRNWDVAPKFIKYYLTVAVVILMFITSMGIFGFLSKAHLEQSLVSGDSTTKLAIYDEKIKTAKENIDANRKALKQMDEGVDQIMARSSDEKGAEKASALRRSQAKERTYLVNSIEAEQKKIAQLNEERAPIAAEVRKVEAEVGPIKYIAALIYGDNPDQNVMEKAVRFVIICLVLVFDPLAIVLLLAANFSLTRKEPKVEPTAELDDNDQWLSFFDRSSEDHGNCAKCNTKLAYAQGIGPFCPNKKCEVIDGVKEEDVVETPLPPEPPPQQEPKEGWSPRWYQRAKGLIQKKKDGIIEISKDSITEIK